MDREERQKLVERQEQFMNCRYTHQVNFNMPEDVYILGSGPNAIKADSKGVRSIDRIPEDAFVIAVNRGAEIPYLYDVKWKVSVWVIGDFQVMKTDYFKRVAAQYTGKCAFSNRAAAKWREFGTRKGQHILFKMVEKEEMVHAYEPALSNKFRTDCSVSGMALELAFFNSIAYGKKVQRVFKIGVDMGGDSDFKDILPGDWRHGSLWRYRDNLDMMIEYMRDKGMNVYTLSISNLKRAIPMGLPSLPKKHYLPTVAYMTMANLDDYTHDAVTEVARQQYPDELKTHYLIHQRDFKPFNAGEIRRNLGFKMVEFKVEGTWPRLWWLKLEAFLERCDEQVVVIFDEGKRYDGDFTSAAIREMYRTNCKVCWNPEQVICMKGRMFKKVYRPNYGTMLIKLESLKEACGVLKLKYSEGFAVRPGKVFKDKPLPLVDGKPPRREVPLDGFLDLIIQRKFRNSIAIHDRRRFYLFHSESNGFLNHHRRNASENIR